MSSLDHNEDSVLAKIPGSTYLLAMQVAQVEWKSFSLNTWNSRRMKTEVWTLCPSLEVGTGFHLDKAVWLKHVTSFLWPLVSLWIPLMDWHFKEDSWDVVWVESSTRQMRATSLPWLRWFHASKSPLTNQNQVLSTLLLLPLPVINLETSPVMEVSSAYWTCFSQNSFMENCSS
jgi:hypothetical protein